MSRLSLLALAQTTLLTLGASSAFAYIPPGPFIVKNMAATRSAVRVVRISSIVMPALKVSDTSSKVARQHFKVVTIYDAASRAMMSQAFDESGVALYSIEKKDDQLPLSLLVLYDPYHAEILGALKRAEIAVGPEAQATAQTASPDSSKENSKDDSKDTAKDAPGDGDATISLQRWNGSIAWALGQGALSNPQETSQESKRIDGGQLWIEKDSFLPVRLLVGDQDIQFTSYRYSQALPYPRTTTVASRTGLEQLEENTQSVQINPPANVVTPVKALFEDKSLAAGAFTTAGDSSGLKGLIRAYYAESGKGSFLDSAESGTQIISVAVPRPLDGLFTYKISEELASKVKVGGWVRVPFGKSKTHAFVVERPRGISSLPGGTRP